MLRVPDLTLKIKRLRLEIIYFPKDAFGGILWRLTELGRNRQNAKGKKYREQGSDKAHLKQVFEPKYHKKQFKKQA